MNYNLLTKIKRFFKLERIDLANDPDLQKLSKELFYKGYTRYFIHGIGGQRFYNTYTLGYEHRKWRVKHEKNYNIIERKLLFSSSSKQEAIEFYRNYLSKVKHEHLIVKTMSYEKKDRVKKILTDNNIAFKDYYTTFNLQKIKTYYIEVFGADIFKALLVDDSLPIYDDKYAIDESYNTHCFKIYRKYALSTKSTIP